MPIACRHKVAHGVQYCVSDCPAVAPCGAFVYDRVERPDDVPARDPRTIDVAVLDMNHGWPNLGHDSLVHAVLDASCDLLPVLEPALLRLRVISYDVRRSLMLPSSCTHSFRWSAASATGSAWKLPPERTSSPKTSGLSVAASTSRARTPAA